MFKAYNSDYQNVFIAVMNNIYLGENLTISILSLGVNDIWSLTIRKYLPFWVKTLGLFLF